MGERFRGVLSRVCTLPTWWTLVAFPRFAVVGGKACHKCLVTWLRPLCLVSERVDHWKRGLYGSIVGWHIGLFVRHMRISALLQTLSSVSAVRFRFVWSPSNNSRDSCRSVFFLSDN